METFARHIEFVPKYNETVPERGRKEGHQGRCGAFVFRIAVKERIVISLLGRRESILGAFGQIIPDLHAPEKK